MTDLESTVKTMLSELSDAELKLEQASAQHNGSHEHRTAYDTVHHLKYTFSERLKNQLAQLDKL